MPKIRIREVDNTGTPNLGAIPNIVYIPGKAVEAFEPVLYTSAKAFKKEIELKEIKYPLHLLEKSSGM